MLQGKVLWDCRKLLDKGSSQSPLVVARGPSRATQMRTSSWFLIAFLLLGVLMVPAGFTQDYTRFSLPEGALARRL